MRTYGKRPAWPFPQHGKLTAHPEHQWCKWMDGSTRYFGPWRDPDPSDECAKAALKRYLAYLQAREEKRPIQVDASDLTLKLAVNHYLTARKRDMGKGNLSAGQFVSYREVGELLVETFGPDKLVKNLGPADFEFLRSKLAGGPVTVGNQIQWIRSILKWAGEFYGAVPRYGGQFNKPNKREVRRARKVRPLFQPAEIRKVLKVASPALRCFILLGINCGFGQMDCAKLSVMAVDLKKRIIDIERTKTGIRRVCPLWPETIKAIKAYERPNDKMPELFFITKYGKPWVKETLHADETDKLETVSYKDSVSQELRKACKEGGVAPRGFYTLRHTFNTIAEGAADPNARKVIMGHTFDGMDEFYLHLHQQPEFMKRLQKASEFVRHWVYGGKS